MSAERMSVAEERKTARSLEKSLESTCRGLRLFLETLERSGLRQAERAYRELQLVLIQQRLWARSYRRSELEPLFRKLAETASALHKIFADFAAVFEPLKYLESVGAAEVATSTPAEQPASAAETSDVLLRRAGITERELRRLNSTEAAAIEQFLEAGVLERRGWGRGRAYRLAPGARRQLAAQLNSMVGHPQTQRQRAAAEET